MSDYARGAALLTVEPLMRQSSALPCQHDSNAACPACLAATARELVAASDVIDQAEARARAAWAEGYAAAERITRDQAEAEGYMRAIGDVKAAEHGLVAVFGEVAKTARARWHLCCRACRLGGHRPGCRDCRERTRESFAEAMGGDYPGRAA